MTRPDPNYGYFPGGKPAWPFPPIVRSSPTEVQIPRLTRKRWRVLQAVQDGRNTTWKVAKHLKLSHPSASRMVAFCRESGLIVRGENDPTVVALHTYSITPLGRKVLKETSHETLRY